MTVPAFPDAAEADQDEGFLPSRDGTRLYWQRYTPPSPRAVVAVFPGGGDHSGRYPGVTAALVKVGFTVALVDFRGHGRSDGRRWHVDAFQDYLDDADAFVGKVQQRGRRARVFVIGHSQGGLIAATWGLAPGRGVSGFVLSSPYFRLAMKPPTLKVLGAEFASKLVPWLPTATGLRYADLTSDGEMQRWTERDTLYGKATTPRWFTESRRAQAEVLRRAGEFAYPLLVLTGRSRPVADADAA